MKTRLIYCLLALTLSAGCKSKPKEAAPITDGTVWIYDVTESRGNAVTYVVTVTFTQKGDVYDVSFDATEPGDKFEAIQVDSQLIPEDNVVSAFDIGRFWLPTEGRASGRRSVCGVTAKQRKFKGYDVWPVEGVCGRAEGTRYYDVNTGLLVGFQQPSAGDREALLRSNE